MRTSDGYIPGHIQIEMLKRTPNDPIGVQGVYHPAVPRPIGSRRMSTEGEFHRGQSCNHCDSASDRRSVLRHLTVRFMGGTGRVSVFSVNLSWDQNGASSHSPGPRQGFLSQRPGGQSAYTAAAAPTSSTAGVGEALAATAPTSRAALMPAPPQGSESRASDLSKGFPVQQRKAARKRPRSHRGCSKSSSATICLLSSRWARSGVITGLARLVNRAHAQPTPQEDPPAARARGQIPGVKCKPLTRR